MNRLYALAQCKHSASDSGTTSGADQINQKTSNALPQTTNASFDLSASQPTSATTQLPLNNSHISKNTLCLRALPERL